MSGPGFMRVSYSSPQYNIKLEYQSKLKECLSYKKCSLTQAYYIQIKLNDGKNPNILNPLYTREQINCSRTFDTLQTKNLMNNINIIHTCYKME